MVHNLSLLAASTTYSLTGPGVVPTGNGVTQMEKIVSNVIGVLTIVGVLYFIFIIIIGGYNFISAQGDEKQIEVARKQLTNGVLGLVIVVVAVGIGSLIALLLGIPGVLDLTKMFGTLHP